MQQAPLPANEYRRRLSPAASLTPREKETASFLIVDVRDERSDLLKKALRECGLSNSSSVANYESAIVQLRERSFSHVIFSIQAEDRYTPDDFLTQAMHAEDAAFYIALAAAPNAEDIFRLLQGGAQGFLLDPFSSLTVEEVITQSTKGEPFSQTILTAKDRNRVFASLVSRNLDRVADSRRRNSDSIDQEMESLQRATKSARLFSQGGEGALLDSFVNFFSSLTSGPATSLGRLRERLRQKRTRK